jgi:hypothetical protein
MVNSRRREVLRFLLSPRLRRRTIIITLCCAVMVLLGVSLMHDNANVGNRVLGAAALIYAGDRRSVAFDDHFPPVAVEAVT